MAKAKILDSDRLMNMDEAADFLNIKKSTIYTMTMRKEIPCVKIGKLNRFRRAALIKWIKARERGKKS